MLKNEYFNVDDLWCDTIKHLLAYGKQLSSRAGQCIETVGYAATLLNVNSTLLMNRRRNISPHYACAELLWYLSSNASIEMISAYAPQYVAFAEDGRAFGAYGYRNYSNLWQRDGSQDDAKSQLELVIEHLRQDPNTRQAVMTFWEANDLTHAIKKDHKDLPCTLSLQFLLRDGKLHLIATMRSNDVWLGLLYDVFAFTSLQWIVAMALGVETGTYTHQVGSEHLYARNWKAAEEAITSKYALTPEQRRLQHGWQRTTVSQIYDAITAVREIERLAREGSFKRSTMFLRVFNDVYTHGCMNVLYDAAATCAAKWSVGVRPTSPILLSSIDIRNDDDADHRGK